MSVSGYRQTVQLEDVGACSNAFNSKTELDNAQTSLLGVSREDGKTSNSEKLLLPSIYLCHLCN